MTERLTEQIATALDGYFDFGETGRDAEEEAAYLIAEHVSKRLPGYRLLDPDDIAALQKVLDYLFIPEQEVKDAYNRLAALIGDDGNG